MSWDGIVAIGTLLLAVGTFAVAALARGQLKTLRKQVNDAASGVQAAQESARSAESSANSTKDVALDSARSRADESAPRVIALIEEPSWPPLLDDQRGRMPGGNEERLFSKNSLERVRQLLDGERFVFDRDRGRFVWFYIRGVLVNEGKASARVRLDGEARFTSGMNPFESSFHVDQPAKFGAGSTNEYLLRPGQSAVFEWGTGYTAGEWADARDNALPQRGFLVVTVMDFQKHGVIDHIYVEFSGRPLEPVPGELGNWQLAAYDDKQWPAPPIGVTVYPIQRTYRWDWPNYDPPPWQTDQ
jgi:hypothetical protein